MWTNANAKMNDDIILIKPLGTGAATAALKRQIVTEADISEVIQSMSQLNHILDLLTNEEALAIHAGTDLTGFGLAGHAMQMANASGVSMTFEFSKIPLFAKTLDFLSEGMITKAHRTNKEYTIHSIEISKLTEVQALTLFDPQTSGGLFLSVDKKHSKIILNKIKNRFLKAEIIGEVITKNEKSLYFE